MDTKLLKKKPKSKPADRFPKTADGKVQAGPGRPKGMQNKISGQAKENIAAVFDSEEMGGINGMIAWALEHKTEFYANVYTKLIPLQVQGKINAEVSGDGQLLASAMVDALARTITSARRARDSGGVGEGMVVVIDNDATEEFVPQLVLSSKAGTKPT